MGRRASCQYCGADLDLGQEFVYEVEAQEFEQSVAPMDVVRALPDYYGEPLRTCKACRESIEGNRRDIEEEVGWEQAGRRFARRVWACIGIMLLLLLLAALVSDLIRWYRS